MFENLYDFCLRHAKWTLVSAAVIITSSAFFIKRLPIELDLYGKEISGFRSTADYQEQRARYKDANSAIFVFSAHRVFTDTELCSIKKWLQDQQASNLEVQSVASPFQIRAAELTQSRIWYQPIIHLDCKTVQGNSFPLTALKETPWRSVLTDQSGYDLGVEFLFRDTIGPSRFGRFNPEPIRTTYNDARTTLASQIQNLEIFMVGPAAFQLHLKEAIVHDLALQCFIFVLFLIVFRIAFGTYMSGAFFLGTLIIDLMLVFGGMAAFGQPLDLLTNNLTLMTAIAGVEDFLFVAVMMKARETSWREAMRAMIKPCFFTTLTTVIGFVSLTTSDVQIVGRFGLWAGWATLVEWAVFFLICPALLTYLPTLGRWIDPQRAFDLGWIRRLAELKPPRIAVFLGGLLFMTGLISFKYLNINDDPTRNFPKTHLNTRSFDYIENTRGWRAAMSIVFQDTLIGEKRTKVEKTLDAIRKNPNVAATFSPFDAVDFLGRGLPYPLKSVAANDFKGTPAYRRLFSASDQVRSTVYLKNADLQSMQSFIKDIEQICPDKFCRVVGQSAVYMEVSDKIIPTLLSSFAASIALVVTVLIALSFWLRVPNKTALVYSAIWGPVTMMAFIAVLQIPVSLITSLFAAIIVGLTGDNAIQYIFASENGDLQQGLEERGEASVLLTLILSASSTLFLLQTVTPMKILGVLFFIGFVVNFTGDLWLLKALLPARDRNKKSRQSDGSINNF